MNWQAEPAPHMKTARGSLQTSIGADPPSPRLQRDDPTIGRSAEAPVQAYDFSPVAASFVFFAPFLSYKGVDFSAVRKKAGDKRFEESVFAEASAVALPAMADKSANKVRRRIRRLATGNDAYRRVKNFCSLKSGVPAHGQSGKGQGIDEAMPSEWGGPSRECRIAWGKGRIEGFCPCFSLGR
jgi:hypothetical protein